MSTSTPLVQAVRELLNRVPENVLPLTYQQVAMHLGLTPPRTIQQVTQALEQSMRQDAANERPFIAALVVSRRDHLPASGFFELAAALGRFPDGSSSQNAWREEYAKALAAR